MRGKGLDRAEELALALAALDEAAGPEAALVSLSCDAAGAPKPAARLQALARVTRATKTLLFLAAEVSEPSSDPTFVLSAVYRRPRPGGA
ncbi:MAG: hypothetical protein KGS44_14195 [Alphaproteobacteria bacterium]|jgi:uncharacterized protein (DUF1778 family)|nr:hypothetical protein [Alphaproteobacteria bacterium]